MFARHNDAATEAQSILKANFKGVEPLRFVVPLYVEVLNHAGQVPINENCYRNQENVLWLPSDALFAEGRSNKALRDTPSGRTYPSSAL